MALPAHITRHPDDRRILRGRTSDDLLLFRTRREEDFEAILCPLNPPPGLLSDSWKFHAAGERPDFAKTFMIGGPAEAAGIVKSIETLPPSLAAFSLPLIEIFARATACPGDFSFRIDNTWPEQLHNHQTTLTCEFIGNGTVWANEAGRELYAGPQSIFLFSEAIAHRASQQTPRVTLAIGC